MTEQTLYLLVTCSMDSSRAEIATQVADNLLAQDRKAAFLSDLVVFDNASRFADHLSRFPMGPKLLRADRNVGFWTAIDWTLRNHRALLGRDYRYLYVIESDLLHFAMERLAACEAFLERTPDVGGVRTQEFSVRLRFLYDKRCPRWFRRTNAVQQTNALTGAPVRFTLADPAERIFVSNFHAKIPALNRMTLMQEIFADLRGYASISEIDFMRLFHERSRRVAQIDGGLFHALVNVPQAPGVSGSYSTPQELAALGYRATRADRILGGEEYTVSPWRGDA